MDVAYSNINEARAEKLLSNKLLEGFVLVDQCCPVCSTPLVKNMNGSASSSNGKKKIGSTDHFMVPASSFDQPFRPVPGVPMCVVCDSHVVTQESEIDLLERCNSLKDKGTILVSMKHANRGEEKKEDEEFNRATVHEIINLNNHVDRFETVEEKPQIKGRGPSPETVQEPKSKDVDDEYSVRREVATKVLGAKMLHGYTLKETTCDRCGMPLMEKRGKEECVVCPALAKKAKKKLKAEKKIAQERARLELEISLKKEFDAEQRRKREKEDRATKDKLEKVTQERIRLETRIVAETEEERLKKEQRKIELAAEEARLLALEQEEEARIAALEEEEARLLREARERAQDHARHQEHERLETLSKQKAEEERLAEIQRRTEERLTAERAKQKDEEIALLEETRRLEEIETQTLATKTEEMHKDLLKHEHRRRIAKKLVLDGEVAKLENERYQEQLELRRLAEEKKAEEESKILAALEAEAAAKALAAEDAIRKAKAALETVNNTKKEMIAETIALAEKEAIAECEETIKAEREDYKEKVILPSESEIYRERWETLRVEGRAIMTRRVLKGWELIPEACQGAECQMTPLLMKNGRKECVVCGGSGSGLDGVYAEDKIEENLPFDDHPEPTKVPSEIEAGIIDGPLAEGHEEEFEEQRDLVSKEIGKRMLEGWTLLDASCPKCVMPLMMDNLGNTNICVIHGAVQPYDSSKTDQKDLEALVDEPTVGETEVPTETDIHHESQVKGEDLLNSIRERASQQNGVSSVGNSRSDPPAFTKATKSKVYGNQEPPADDPRPMHQNNETSKQTSLDFADPKSVQQLLGSAADYEDEEGLNSLTPDMVARMFMKSPQGHDFQHDEFDMSFREMRDLIDIFAAANFEQSLSEAFRGDVAENVMYRLKNGGNTPMIHLEDMASPESDSPRPLPRRSAPRNFHFDDFDDGMSVQSSARQRGKPNPELMMGASAAQTRPQTVSTSPTSPTKSPRPPRSPQKTGSKTSPRSGGGGPIVVGGPLSKSHAIRSYPQHHYSSDMRSVGEASRASTVASDALESIYVRIDECKAKLMDPTNSVTEQLATADLLEKLAKAAVAVRTMEKLEEE